MNMDTAETNNHQHLGTHASDFLSTSDGRAGPLADVKNPSAAPSATTSDAENAERPVREKLKKTSIATLPQESSNTSDKDTTADLGTAQHDDAADASNERAAAISDENGDRGRLRRKRSLEDVERAEDHDEKANENQARHLRKRSRDVELGPRNQESGWRKTSGESSVQEEDEDGPTVDDRAKDEVEEEAGLDHGHAGVVSGDLDPMEDAGKPVVVSPKNKRSLDEFVEDHVEARSSGEVDREDLLSTGSDGVAAIDAQSKNCGEEERKTKRHRDSNSPQASEKVATADQEERKVRTATLWDLYLSADRLQIRYRYPAASRTRLLYPPSPARQQNRIPPGPIRPPQAHLLPPASQPWLLQQSPPLPH